MNFQSSFRKDNSSPRSEMKMQDVFLNHCRKRKTPVIVQLNNRGQQQGEIIGFDSRSIILETSGCQMLIYKNAIVMINPQEKVNFIFGENPRHKVSDSGSEYPTHLT